jgi:hypothetical protein
VVERVKEKNCGSARFIELQDIGVGLQLQATCRQPATVRLQNPHGREILNGALPASAGLPQGK